MSSELHRSLRSPGGCIKDGARGDARQSTDNKTLPYISHCVASHLLVCTKLSATDLPAIPASTTSRSFASRHAESDQPSEKDHYGDYPQCVDSEPETTKEQCQEQHQQD